MSPLKTQGTFRGSLTNITLQLERTSETTQVIHPPHFTDEENDVQTSKEADWGDHGKLKAKSLTRAQVSCLSMIPGCSQQQNLRTEVHGIPGQDPVVPLTDWGSWGRSKILDFSFLFCKMGSKLTTSRDSGEEQITVNVKRIIIY